MEKIEACMDSHVHWQATGEFSQRLDLSPLNSAAEILKIKPEPQHFRGEWIFGFGWDQSRWPGGAYPTREILDQWQPKNPVVLSRCDGHTYWVNSAALKAAGMLENKSLEISGGKILRSELGFPTGVLVDAAKEPIDQVMPKLSPFDIRRQLLKGVQIFNEAGFTHIRDMTCNPTQYQEALKLDQTGLLTLAVEEYFWLEEMSELSSLLEFCRSAKNSASPNLRVKGLKIFIDGSLGSESAHLSCAYHGGSHGLSLWADQELFEIFVKTWDLGLALAIHSIGDAASARVLSLLQKLKERGHEGEIHIEHAQVLQPETIEQMREFQITCHLQPCHFLSDQTWLKQRLGALYHHSFPWRALQQAGIPITFGSDSPLEKPSYANTLLGLEKSAEAGIPKLLGKPQSYMSHPDHAWCPNSFSIFSENQPTSVVFRGEHLL